MRNEWTDLVVAICQRATSHNYGQTVFGAEQDFATGDITVKMSSWPRANEATKALVREGYTAEHVGDCCVLVRAS